MELSRLSCQIALTLTLAAMPIAAASAAEGQERGWGSSWTAPHSAEEKASRELTQRLNKAAQAQDWATVAKVLDDAERTHPNSLEIPYMRAHVEMIRHRYRDAVSHYDHALKTPSAKNSTETASFLYVSRAYAVALQGSYGAARTDLEHAIGLNRNNTRAQNNYAWLLATCPDPHVRDGKRAVTFARALNKQFKQPNPMTLDTLAAAQAEAGDFRAAIKTQQSAISAVKGDRSIYQKHLQSFQRGEPLREAPEPQRSVSAVQKS